MTPTTPSGGLAEELERAMNVTTTADFIDHKFSVRGSVLRAVIAALRSQGEPVAWLVRTKNNKFSRGIYENPTAEDFEIWRLDGDTAIPLYALPSPPATTKD